MRWPMSGRSVGQFAPIAGRWRGAIGHEKVRRRRGALLEAGHDWKNQKNKVILIIKDVDKVDKFLDQEAHFLLCSDYN